MSKFEGYYSRASHAYKQWLGDREPSEKLYAEFCCMVAHDWAIQALEEYGRMAKYREEVR